jgi:hypothetical protein
MKNNVGKSNLDVIATEYLIENIPNTEEGQIKIKKILLKYSYYLVKLSHNEEINFNDWLKAYLKYSKALFLNEKYDKSIMILINLLDIFSVIPLDELKFLQEINKKNKISFINNFINFDVLLKFFSKSQVYKKCESIFEEEHLKKQDIFGEIEELNLNDDDSMKKRKRNNLSDNNSNEENENSKDENSSRENLSKSVSRYGNQFYQDSNERRNANVEKILNTEASDFIYNAFVNPNLEINELKLNNNNIDKGFYAITVQNNENDNDDLYKNNLDDSINMEIEKNKKKEAEKFKDQIKNGLTIDKLKNLNNNNNNNNFENNKSKEKDKDIKKKLNKKLSKNKVTFNNKDFNKNDNNNNNIRNEIKLLNPDEDLNKFNEDKFINERSDYNNSKNNKNPKSKFDDISLVQIKEKNFFNEIEYNELYYDNIENVNENENENEDDLYEDSSIGKSIKIPDLNIKSMSKFEEFLDNSIENIEINHDNFSCILKYFNFYIFNISFIFYL